MAALPFDVEVLAPDGVVLRTRADSVTLPSTAGMVGILAHRAPLIMAVGTGPLTVRAPHRKHTYFVEGGIACARDNRLTVIVEHWQKGAKSLYASWEGHAPPGPASSEGLTARPATPP